MSPPYQPRKTRSAELENQSNTENISERNQKKSVGLENIWNCERTGAIIIFERFSIIPSGDTCEGGVGLKTVHDRKSFCLSCFDVFNNYKWGHVYSEGGGKPTSDLEREKEEHPDDYLPSLSLLSTLFIPFTISNGWRQAGRLSIILFMSVAVRLLFPIEYFKKYFYLISLIVVISRLWLFTWQVGIKSF